MTDRLSVVAAAWRHLAPSFAVEAARQDQDARWAAGERPPAEVYLAALPRVAASADDALVVVYGEVMNRTALGEPCHPAEYARRFPQYADRLADLFAVHAALAPGPGAADGPAEDATATAVPPPVRGYGPLTFAARGGSAVVYRGTDERTGDPVAVKLLTRSATQGMLLRLIQEGEILARLRHPNVVRFVSSGEADGRPFVVSEWVDGGTLAARTAGARVPPAVAAELVAVLADAVHAAHEQGIVHRDLKPANVLLTADGVPKVADFGTARLTGCDGLVTATGDVIGTAAYMPPEQVEGRRREVGPAADGYALGAMLYELLTGRPPFAGRTLMDVVHRVLTEPPVPPDGIVPALPGGLADVCLRCLEKRPERRFPSAAHLAAAARAVRV